MGLSWDGGGWGGGHSFAKVNKSKLLAGFKYLNPDMAVINCSETTSTSML